MFRGRLRRDEPHEPRKSAAATHAQRLASVGTLVRVLEPPVKEGGNQVRLRSGCMSWSTGHGLVIGLPLRILLTVGALIEHSYDQRNKDACFSALRAGASRLNWVS